MKKMLFIMAAFVFVVGLSVLPVTAGEKITIKGEVLENATIFGEDSVTYFIAGDEKGEEVWGMEGKIVEIKGTVEESDGRKTITVESYEVKGAAEGG